MENIQVYETALQTAAFYCQPQAGYLRLTGADRVDFLQRQTTNDLRTTNAERTVTTVLTSPTARILDLLCVIDEGESLGVITLPGRNAETEQFLRSRIFFSDQVDLKNLSSDYGQILLLGPQAADVLKSFEIEPPEPGYLEKGFWASHSITVIARKHLTITGYLLIVPEHSQESLLADLQEAKLPSLSSEVFETLRIESGQPGPIGELVDDYTPLEVRLDDYISDAKGCYTGQEIIARQVTYGKVAKRLVGLALSAAIEPGANLEVDGKSVGTLTSVAQSPRFGIIGLGVVRRPHYEVGAELSVSGGGQASVQATIHILPFE